MPFSPRACGTSETSGQVVSVCVVRGGAVSSRDVGQAILVTEIASEVSGEVGQVGFAPVAFGEETPR